jgi:outer membrane protein
MAVFCCVSVPASAESLQEALALVYSGNPAIQSERATLRETDEGVAQAVSGWRPTVSAQAGAGVSHQEYDTTSGNLHPSDASLSLSQPLYRGGRTAAATRQAEATVLQERAKLSATEQSVFVDAATAYMDVVQDRLVMRLYQQNKADLENWLRETQERFRLGDKTQTDIAQAQSRLAQAEAGLNTANINLQGARAAYRRYVGQEPGTLQKLPALPGLLPATQEAALAQAAKDSPTVLQAEYAARAGAANIDAVKGNLLPEVSLQGQLSHAWNENVPQQFIDDNHTVNDQVMVQVKVPLYTGGADYARLRAAYQDKSARRRDLDEARREARQQAEQAWQQMQISAENITVRRRQIVAAKAALDGMKKEERVGDRSSTDRLDALRDLLNARIATVQAEHDRMVSLFHMMAATGSFTADKLQLPVKLYDPAAHYANNRNRWIGIGDADQEE